MEALLNQASTIAQGFAGVKSTRILIAPPLSAFWNHGLEPASILTNCPYRVW